MIKVTISRDLTGKYEKAAAYLIHANVKAEKSGEELLELIAGECEKIEETLPVDEIMKLEEIANTTPGVEKSFAIQAGREIRIIAKPEEVNDEEIVFLAREISKKIEAELEYPGQIKVNVVRETRAVDYAK